MHAIGRLEGVEGLLLGGARQRAPQGFVLFPLPAVRVAVAEGREVVRADAVPDDVVARRALVVDQAQLRPVPLDAVAAFGVAYDRPVVVA